MGVGGCSCAGSDCDSLVDLATCEAVHVDCAAQPQSCGGIYYNPCPEGQFCDYGAHCGAGDQSGVCTDQPDMCTEAWAPVCGCDNQTYGNACEAFRAGVPIQHHGPCKNDPLER